MALPHAACVVRKACAADHAGGLKTIWGAQICEIACPETERAYMHNGYFKTLAGVVHFHNARGALPRCEGAPTEAGALAAKGWPAPEVAPTMNRDELGNLKLAEAEEADLVAFPKTLDDA